MNLEEMTDVNELKALAYDQLALLEQTQRNLAAVNQRINQVQADKREEAQAALPQATEVEPEVDKAQAVTS